jgi:hypothetical protein
MEPLNKTTPAPPTPTTLSLSFWGAGGVGVGVEWIEKGPKRQKRIFCTPLVSHNISTVCMYITLDPKKIEEEARVGDQKSFSKAIGS